MIHATVFEQAADAIANSREVFACTAITSASPHHPNNCPYHILFTKAYKPEHEHPLYINAWLGPTPHLREIFLREMALNLRAQGYDDKEKNDYFTIST